MHRVSAVPWRASGRNRHGWTLDITAVPEPVNVALGIFAGVVVVGGIVRTRRVRAGLRRARAAAVGRRALTRRAVVEPQPLPKARSTAEARRTQRGRAATETAEYAKYAEGGTQTVLFSAYSVFRGSNPQGSCSQAANNLIYCSTVQRKDSG